MAEVTGTLLKHRKRLTEIADVLVRHGWAAWAARGAGIAEIGSVASLVQRATLADGTTVAVKVPADRGSRFRDRRM